MPGLADRDIIRRLVAEIGAPINILANAQTPPVPELKAIGVRRVSVGGLITAAAYGLARRAAEELRNTGTYGFASGVIPHADLNALLKD